MWVLLIILLTAVPGIERATVLNTFATEAECDSERERISLEMALAYPDDHDFLIACRPRKTI